MKRRNSKIAGQILLTGIFMFTVSLLFSCKKNSITTTSPKNNMGEIAKSLDGDLLIGNISVESDNNEVALNINNGSMFILASEIPNSKMVNIPGMQSAEVITSKYGVILKDQSNDRLFFLVNNDPESIKKFENVQSSLTGSFQSDKIYGTTIVNSEKS